MYLRRDIHSWSNFPNKPDKIPDVPRNGIIEKQHLIFLSVLFIDKMHCLIDSHREVTGLFVFLIWCKNLCFSNSAKSAMCYWSKTSTEQWKEHRETKILDLYFSQ